MGRKRKQVSGVSANAAAIISAKGWRVSVFNGGTHLRINGVVDVWPTRRRWMPTVHGPNQYAENYRDIAHLRTIVSTHEGLHETKQQRTAKWFASLPEGEQKKEPVRGIATWEEFGRRFDGPIPHVVNPRLFEPKSEPARQQKYHTEFPPLKPLRESSDDGRPPWE